MERPVKVGSVKGVSASSAAPAAAPVEEEEVEEEVEEEEGVAGVPPVLLTGLRAGAVAVAPEAPVAAAADLSLALPDTLSTLRATTLVTLEPT